MEIVAGTAIIAFLAIWFAVFFGAPYVPSKTREIRDAFKNLYPLSRHDTLVDLGSGDGVVLRVAREFGATAVGYELSPLLVWISKALARGDTKQTVINMNYARADFPKETTAVYVFSDGRDIGKLYQLVETQAAVLHRSLALIVYGFSVAQKTPVKTHGAYYLYEVAPCSKRQA